MGSLPPYVPIGRALAINPGKEYVRDFFCTPDPLTLTVPAAGRDEFKFVVDSYGNFEWTSIIGESTDTYFLEIFDPAHQRKLSNKPIPSPNIVGTGMRPFRLPEPYLINVGDARREIIVTAHNTTSGSPNTIRLALHGRRFYHHMAPPDVAVELAKRMQFDERTYSYFMAPTEPTLDGTPVSVAAGNSTTFTFSSDANADSDIEKMMVLTTGTFTMSLREIPTNRNLMNDVVLSNLAMGSAQFPFRFADTLFLERDKQLVMTLTNVGLTTATIMVTLAGRALRYETR